MNFYMNCKYFISSRGEKKVFERHSRVLWQLHLWLKVFLFDNKSAPL